MKGTISIKYYLKNCWKTKTIRKLAKTNITHSHWQVRLVYKYTYYATLCVWIIWIVQIMTRENYKSLQCKFEARFLKNETKLLLISISSNSLKVYTFFIKLCNRNFVTKHTWLYIYYTRQKVCKLQFIC